MKISKWEDLWGKKNEEYALRTTEIYIRIFKKGHEILTIDIRNTNQDIILKTLALYGFDIEFEVPKITRWEKFKKEDKSIGEIKLEFDKYCKQRTLGVGCTWTGCGCFYNWLSELGEGE